MGSGRISIYFAIGLALLATASASVGAGTEIRAVTVPSADVTLSFVQPGRIAAVLVKEGNAVKAGQVLVQQDDAVERAQLEQLEAESLNTAQIRASEASLEQKQVDLKKLDKAASLNAATELEVEHARLDVKMAELSLEVAKHEHEQAKRKYEEAKIKISNMQLTSPIDGVVEDVHVEAGESANALEDIIRVVSTDPLRMDVPVQLTIARTLKSGETVKVEFPDPQRMVTDARIVHIAAVADAASNTLHVRVEVSNKTKRPAGEHVKVIFPSPRSY